MSESHSDAILAEAVLSALRVDRSDAKDRIFCLGANVGRISFASQQIRALNLVWALGKAGLLGKDRLVAVIGGGISGITAATAVRGHGCSVRVFESGRRELYRQRSTTHRHIHPSVNWWPQDDVLPTTSLPFLNWSFECCEAVIDLLVQNWRNVLKKSKGSVQIEFDNTIQNLHVDESNEGRIILQSTSSRNSVHFDLVIVATGFGDEFPGEETNGSKIPALSYWDPDGLEQARDDPKGPRHFVISGTGDGGLIDALRLCYDFRFGRLAFRLAEVTSKSPLAARVAEIEAKRDTANWRAECLNYEKVARDIYQSDTTNTLDDVYRIARDTLEEYISADHTGLVTLAIKDHESPYEGAAAPIHKLLIAYAKLRAVLVYKKGSVSDLVKHSDEETTATVGDIRVDKSKIATIFRHGAPRYRKGVLSEPEWQKIASNQASMASFSHKPFWNEDLVPVPVPVPDPLPCLHGDPNRYMNSLLTLAQKVFVELKSPATVSATRENFIVQGHESPYRPATLFGRPVLYQTEEDLNEADAL